MRSAATGPNSIDATITRRTENDNATPIKLARRYLIDAQAFHQAAKELDQSDKPEVKGAPPQHYLECHALELILKSFILSSGGTEREVRGIRHNLCKARTRAIELGLSPADPDTETLIKNLGPITMTTSFDTVGNPGGSRQIGLRLV
jgi:hypothetical protein